MHNPNSNKTEFNQPIQVVPNDQFNQELVSNVHPSDWVNPKPDGTYNLVVIGAGTAGLVSAIGAAGLGAKVALVERYLMGGDCLNYGCVPSKGVLRSAHLTHLAKKLETFGVKCEGVSADFSQTMERMRRLRARISHHDSAKRFADQGIDVFLGNAQFTSPNSVQVGEAELLFKKAVITTGARASTLPIPGLEECGYLTNESVFTLTELPRVFCVIGSGPIGCEMAQAFCRLGSNVTMITNIDRLLPNDDLDAANLLRNQLESDGVRILFSSKITRFENRDGQKTVQLQHPDVSEVPFDEVLLAVGRIPNLDGLNLEAAEVTYSKQGITVDEQLRTSNKAIYAAGDICSAYKFTHAADAMARIVIQNALFLGRKKVTDLHIPWCTYTNPEVSHVGKTASQLEKDGISHQTITVNFEEIDRAVLEGCDQGFAKVYYGAKGKILGATIVGSHAGEMISQLSLAISSGLSLPHLSGTIYPYPTQTEVLKRLGDAYNRTRLTPNIVSIMKRFLAWQRK